MSSTCGSWRCGTAAAIRPSASRAATGRLGGINRLLLTDVTADTGGFAYNGSAQFGLVSLRTANMEVLVHEIGHGWMNWPHSYAEIRWRPHAGDEGTEPPNPYSNPLDFMSALTLLPVTGWRQDMPSTLAINRYAAGWIPPEEVALHVSHSATYTLRPPRRGGHQFLVLSSGRPGAFTTLEVLDERNPAYVDEGRVVYDPSAPAGLRPYRYEGILVSRYDQSTGTGAAARFGPALFDTRNPGFRTDVGWGRDDYSVIHSGEAREVGGGVRVAVTRNADGSYQVAVTGGRTAPFAPWCAAIWFEPDQYDTGCALDSPE